MAGHRCVFLRCTDFAACVRSVLIAGLYPKEKDSLTLFERGAVTHAKSNLAPRGLALEFELRQDSFTWTGTSNTDASDFTADKDAKNEEERGNLADACDFLKEMLAKGPGIRAAIIEQGKRAGIAERTIERASVKLRVTKQRIYEDGKVTGATWELPK